MGNSNIYPFSPEFDHRNIRGISATMTLAEIEEMSTAESVAKNLYQEIIKYQESLPESDDVALRVVQFNQSVTIFVDSIGYIGYNLISFSGTDSSGKPQELIQHVSQLNFLLTVVPKPTPEAPKRVVGFQSPNGQS